ncbi:imidazolonepropionase [Paracrocinitomix mangrovi]|uniref:imidazolonepropionase n=1 Tax=Paracrocinitomix mangrovi TaxID=2862509 RepID=UPI001C8D3CBC|nr:imidazolonepropionase [Paracrocinitomix mangrovi]UKN00953.1 imidazolonepropionase [Paracrocinitomix mangrovi]
MSKLLIKNIKGLVGILENNSAPLKGKELGKLETIEDAFLAVEDGRISMYGKMQDLAGITDWSDLEVIDAEGKYVLPAFCDSHSHLVFAKTREEEFVDRIKGLSYEEIGKKGGGILNSARKLADMSEVQLVEDALKRLELIKSTGTGAIEIKSGYGLSTEAELKMLRVIKTLKEKSDVSIKATFLGAHAFPTEYKDNQDGYVDLLINEMLPKIAAENLAEYIDVFCERNYFTAEQTDRILEAGVKAGLKPKIHVNQFSVMGGISVGVKHNAVSVDHLEELSDEDVAVLKNAKTIATALPSCSFFLSIPYTPIRKLIDNNVACALATDYNPGSTPSGNMLFVNSLACIKMKMTPEEAINATTINGAYAMELGDELGSITVGKKANLIITKTMPSLDYLAYSFGENVVERTILS